MSAAITKHPDEAQQLPPLPVDQQALKRIARAASKLSVKHKQVADLILGGLSNKESYLKVYGSSSSENAASQNAFAITRRIEFQEYLQAVKEGYFPTQALSLAEKRAFLGRAVRSTPETAQLPENQDLAGIEFKDKLAAIKIDNELSGDNKPQEVNVSLRTILDAVAEQHEGSGLGGETYEGEVLED